MSNRQAAVPRRDTDGGNASTTLRALVVDDEPHIRALLVRLLLQAGFSRIEELPDGAAAVAAVERERVDLMLLDLAMPELRGEEVARRTLQLWPRAAVIVITGHATIEGAVELMKSGIFDLVRKPFEFRTLRATLTRAVERLGAPPPKQGPPSRKIGRYAIQGELASGGMGTVYRATDEESGKIVALKVLRVGRPDPEQVVRFQMEASTLARLEHPNIVAAKDIGLHEGVHYLAMEFVEGVHLGELIYANRLSFRRGIELLATVAEAVEHAHQHGVIHRDLKPSNVLVDPQGTPHIIDFGLAKYLHSSLRLTRTDLVLGTFGYLAPERLFGGTVDEGVDIFSLGAILYEMLTHALPYERDDEPEGFPVFTEPAEPPSKRNPGVPPRLDAICLRALAVEREERYPTAGDLAVDLRKFLRDSDGLGMPRPPAAS